MTRSRLEVLASPAALMALWVAALVGVGYLSVTFQRYPTRTRQAEAKSNLSHIYTLQVAFQGDHGRFGGVGPPPRADAPSPSAVVPRPGPLTRPAAAAAGPCVLANEIDFSITDCDRTRYDYSLEAVSGTAFVAVAREKVVAGKRAIFAGCDGPLDEWTLDQEKRLVARHNAADRCGVASESSAITPAKIAEGAVYLAMLFGVLALADLLVAFAVGLGRAAVPLAARLAAGGAPTLMLGVVLHTAVIGRRFVTDTRIPVAAALAIVWFGSVVVAFVQVRRGACARADVGRRLAARFGESSVRLRLTLLVGASVALPAVVLIATTRFW